MTIVKVREYDPAQREVPALPLSAFAVTKSDTNVFERPITLEVHVAGALAVVPWEGDNAGAATSLIIPAGVAVLGYRTPFRVRQVLSTGTDATVIGIF